MARFEAALRDWKCPDCGKRLFAVKGYGTVTVVIWCRHCKAVKEIPVTPDKTTKF